MSNLVRRWLPEEQALFLGLLNRDELCEGCLAAKTVPDRQRRLAGLLDTYLHCSGCRADRAACLFSAVERRKPQSQRVCIGHEGYIRICEHTTVQWSAIASATARRWKLQTEMQRERVLQLVNCKQSNHFRLHNRSRSLFKLFSRRQKSSDHLDSKNYPTYPQLSTQIIKMPNNESTLRVFLRWSSHMPLAMTEDVRFEADEFAQEIEARYQREGRFICPKLGPAGLSLGPTLCDPVRCDCLSYPGKALFGWERPPTSWVKAKTCREEANRGLIHRFTGGAATRLPWDGEPLAVVAST